MSAIIDRAAEELLAASAVNTTADAREAARIVITFLEAGSSGMLETLVKALIEANVVKQGVSARDVEDILVIALAKFIAS